MAESVEILERRIDALRAAVRQAVMTGDRVAARTVRAELRRAELAWEDAIADLADAAVPDRPAVPAQQAMGEPAGSMLPVREQVHHALTLLTVPAAPKLIVEVHRAFFADEVNGARLTSLRRDEERSFRAAPYARPYYLCAALTADLLAPARGLLAVSTWPLEARIVGSLSPRVHFLTATVRVAEHVARLPEPGPAANRLLWRLAASIPGAAAGFDTTRPEVVARSAGAELAVHLESDEADRASAAARARAGLEDVEQLFGSHLRSIGSARHTS